MVALGKSPYDRPTYRYTPIIAYLLLPNSLFGKKFGKLLFTIIDFITGQVIASSIGSDCKVAACILWHLNPLTINISTRGNCDSIAALLIVCLIIAIEKRKFTVAAVLYGLAVHMRLFPIFFVLSIILNFRWLSIPFGILSGLVFMALNLIFFAFYGNDFLYETFLYHLVRADYRHNFSVPWLSVYLGEKPISFWSLARVIMIVYISLRCKSNLRVCWACIVLCFIGFNSVCTVQYYDWALSLLALIPEHVFRRRFVFCFVLWACGHGLWLQFAYLLEFRGLDVFLWVWFASLVVFVGNNLLLWAVLSESDLNLQCRSNDSANSDSIDSF
jgi:phosphatidylinositol glycan class M